MAELAARRGGADADASAKKAAFLKEAEEAVRRATLQVPQPPHPPISPSSCPACACAVRAFPCPVHDTRPPPPARPPP